MSIYIEHLNIVVSDIEASLKFYQAAFPDWKIRSKGKSLWSGKPRSWLHFGDDNQYIALSDNGETANRDLSGHQIGLAHFAFVVGNLDALITRLAIAGFKVDKENYENPHRENVYYIDPAGFEVEFISYKSDLISERNNDL